MYLWDLDDEPSGKETSFAGVVLMKKSELAVPPTPAVHTTLRAGTIGTGCAVVYRAAYQCSRLFAALASPSGASDASPTGTWDSLHVFESHERGRSAKYKLTATVMLVLETPTASHGDKVEGEAKGKVTLSGSMTRQAEVDYPLTTSAGHIPNIGRLVEDMEWVPRVVASIRWPADPRRIKMRNLLSSVYFGKTKDVINELRSQSGLEAKSREDMLRAELAGRLGGRK